MKIIDDWKWPAQKNTLGYNCWWGWERRVSWILLRYLREYLLKAILLLYMLFPPRDFKLNPFCPWNCPTPNPAFLFYTEKELNIAEGDQLCQLHNLHLHSYPRRSLGGDNQIFASYIFCTIKSNEQYKYKKAVRDGCSHDKHHYGLWKLWHLICTFFLVLQSRHYKVPGKNEIFIIIPFCCKMIMATHGQNHQFKIANWYIDHSFDQQCIEGPKL